MASLSHKHPCQWGVDAATSTAIAAAAAATVAAPLQQQVLPLLLLLLPTPLILPSCFGMTPKGLIWTSAAAAAAAAAVCCSVSSPVFNMLQDRTCT